MAMSNGFGECETREIGKLKFVSEMRNMLCMDRVELDKWKERHIRKSTEFCTKWTDDEKQLDILFQQWRISKQNITPRYKTGRRFI